MEDIKLKSRIEKLNDINQADYGARTNGDYRRQLDKNIIYDNIENTNWKKESDYYNHGTSDTIETSGFNYAKSKAMRKRANEPQGCIDENGELTKIGRAYYAKEIEMVNKKFK